MAPRTNAPSAPGEISLVHLKNCLVNLPNSLVALLENVNTPAQNVIVELSFRAPHPPNGSSPGSTANAQRSIYVGWTGMPSKRRATPVVDRDGIAGGRGGSGRDKEVGLVEIDPTLANTLGLQDGQRVTAYLHIDPPTAHTVNIEPLTPEDWEIIELHATFLELNLLSQIRALPNPVYAPGSSGEPAQTHPLTLHLSPTSTANIKVLSLEPALPADAPFAKIAPDAEVIVAPKVRAKPSRSSRENRSVGSNSKKSGRSTTSTVKRKNSKDERKASLFLRAVDRKYCDEYFDDEKGLEDLTVWVDTDLLVARDFRGAKWVTVSVVRSLSAQSKPPVAGEPPALEASSRVVTQLRNWDDPPNGQAVALSTPLATALGYGGTVGGVIKIEPASPPLPFTATQKNDADSLPSSNAGVQKIKVYPFVNSYSKQSGAGLKFGGESKAEREEDAKRIKHIYGGASSAGLLRGPLTDGMILGVYDGLNPPMGWTGAIIKLDPPPKSSQAKDSASWILASEGRFPLEVQAPIPRPAWMTEAEAQNSLPASENILVGIDTLWGSIRSHLYHMSSVLLTGALGSGKTSIAQSLAQDLKENQLFHTTYFACRKLVNDETRISTIKDALNKVFMEASWGARLGGQALVVLDDLDRLCPAETELQVGNENGRSRQISEAICAIVKQYCGPDSSVVLLATAQGKDSLHNVIIGGHVVREIVGLKAPDKEARRKIMETIAKQGAISTEDRFIRPSSDGSRPTTADGSAVSEDGAWMDGASQRSRGDSVSLTAGFLLEDDLDFLDIAGQTDGYMPRDLELLISRARNEALKRSVNESPLDAGSGAVPFGRPDFDNALKGFTPASLRNVTLQHSTVTFDSIGGLRETRRILLETLEYPTKYAPIFAKCPLRLRSGLLLYGFPGCGKTLLASAVAGECGLNFISVKGPEILNKYIGASEKSVRDLFERAQAARPCVLFFDEFDSIAPKRGHDSTGVTDRVVNQLLTQMDGAEGLSGVYVLAATSRPDLIDPALLRPGRLDKSLLCGFPDAEDRIDIIRALAGKAQVPKEIFEDEDNLHELARRTEGLTGADLQALVSNAQLEAIHDVLGDQGRSATASSAGGRHGAASKKANAQQRGGAANFIKFRYGGEEGADGSANGTSAQPRSAALAEQAAIVAKLEGIKLARRREKALLKGGMRHGADDSQKDGAGDSGNDVVIAWRHIAKALEGTRASISVEERRRLERIYREFVVGRSGEMRDGQGSMEVGGRSSLM